MGFCDCNCVILWTNRAKCSLNKEILDLLNKESVSGACSGRTSNLVRSQLRVFEKVSPALKCHSNFLGVTTYNTYCKTGNVGQQLSLMKLMMPVNR